MSRNNDLTDRTKQYALRVIRLVSDAPSSISGQVIAKQLVRSATSVGANYRSACRARSKAEFVAKLQIALEESDESLYWLELIKELRFAHNADLDTVIAEGNELTAIFVTALKTARNKDRSLLPSSF